MNKTTTKEAIAIGLKHGRRYLTGDQCFYFEPDKLAASIAKRLDRAVAYLERINHVSNPT